MLPINHTIKNIKKQINKNEYRQYWFSIGKTKNFLIAKGNSKRETKKLVQNKINNKPKKYENKYLKRYSLSFHREKHGLNSGALLILVSNFQVINGKIKKIYIKNKEGPIWFKKNWLEYHGWNKKYITKISDYLRNPKIKISGIGVNYYDHDFED